MALNAKTASGGGGNTNFTPMDSGTYPARLVQVIDMGLQPQRPYQGQEKPPVRRVMLTYEFVDEFLKDEEGNEQPDKPRWLSENFPLYNLQSERATSTHRYNAMDPDCIHDGDFSKLLGIPVNVTVVQNPGTGKNVGKVYENIDSVSPMRPKDAERCPALVNEPRLFDLDDPDMETFLALPKWLKDVIQSNLEYEGSKLQKMLGDPNAGPGTAQDEQALETESEENPY